MDALSCEDIGHRTTLTSRFPCMSRREELATLDMEWGVALQRFRNSDHVSHACSEVQHRGILGTRHRGILAVRHREILDTRHRGILYSCEMPP